MMKLLKFLWHTLFSIYGYLLFIIMMLVLFPFIVVASFYGKVLGGNAIYKICQLWTDALFCCWGIRHKNYFEQPHDINKPSIFVFNHISYLDIPMLMKTICYQHFRVLGKAEMAKVPIFGYIYKNAVVMVDRGNKAKRAASVWQLRRVLNKGISVAIFPEGTFNTSAAPLKEFYDGAFRLAIETQTPIKPILFLDTFDRMHYQNIWSLSAGKSRAIYLEEISVEGLTKEDVQALKKKVFDLMADRLVFYKGSWIKQPET